MPMWSKNLLLVILSVSLVFGGTMVLDRVLGLCLIGPRPLIFPPHSEQTFVSSDFTYTARTNAIGLRERELPADHKAFRILAIGDSFTYGWGNESEQTWLRLTEEKLKADGLDVFAINGGKPGWGPPEYSEFAERAVPVVRPDLVMVCMTLGNDLAGAGSARTTPLTWVRRLYPSIVWLTHEWLFLRQPGRRDELSTPQKSSGEDNRQWAVNNTVKTILEKMPSEQRARFDAIEGPVKQAFLDGKLNPYMVKLALDNPEFYNGTLRLEDSWIKQCIGRMGSHLERIRAVAKRYGAKVLVVSVPDGPYVNDAAYRNIQRVGYQVTPNMIESDAPDRAIAIACEQARVPFVHVTEAFKTRRTDSSLYFELDGHLTPAGHRLYADNLAPRLEEQIAKYVKRKR